MKPRTQTTVLRNKAFKNILLVVSRVNNKKKTVLQRKSKNIPQPFPHCVQFLYWSVWERLAGKRAWWGFYLCTLCWISWSCCGLITLGECVHLSLAWHCWDYTPLNCGSTAPALLIQSLIKVSCKSLRQTQSQPVIGPISTHREREAPLLLEKALEMGWNVICNQFE